MDNLIKALTETFGPSGEEDEVRTLIKSLAKGKIDRVYEDALGNLFLEREGPAPKIMVSAHMDEIGVIITHIDDNGFIRIAPVGGMSAQALPGKRFRFRNGTIGTVYHEKLKNINELDWTKIYLDIGQPDRKAAMKLVNIGDLACYDQSFRALEGGRYISKAMDDRVGCAVILEVLNRLPRELPQAVCFLFSVQEEVGLRGARTAAYRYEPDYGIAVDVTLVGDTPKAPTMEVSLGKGPAIKVKDRSVLCHPLVRKLMIDTAKKNNIPYQLEVLERGGTDAGAIHISREGVPSGAISIPCRYVHTPSEIVDNDDLNNAVLLLEKLLTENWPKQERNY